MSKGRSGFFPKSTSNDKLINILALDAIHKMISDTPGGSGKAMACGAYDPVTGNIATAFAGEAPKKIHPLLQKLAEEIGGIGSHGLTERNTVGVCAEFHVVNELLWKGSKFSDIRLTPAIRPRNGTIQPYCENCIKMFANLIRQEE